MVKNEHEHPVATTLERRAEPRLKTGRSVLIRPHEGPPFEAWLLDVSSRGLRLRLPEQLPVGADIRIEAQELLLYGTVIRCQLSHGVYEAGIALTLPLEMLGELRKLNSALLADWEHL